MLLAGTFATLIFAADAGNSPGLTLLGPPFLFALFLTRLIVDVSTEYFGWRIFTSGIGRMAGYLAVFVGYPALCPGTFCLSAIQFLRSRH
jgi:hypothetical protein